MLLPETSAYLPLSALRSNIFNELLTIFSVVLLTRKSESMPPKIAISESHNSYASSIGMIQSSKECFAANTDHK